MQTKKNNWKALVLLLPAVICLSFHIAVHPFYISVVEVAFKTNEKTIEMGCRLFTDDIQQALANENKQKVNLLEVNATNQNLLANYIKQHIKISIGKQQVSLNCIGYEIKEEAVWCYFESPLKDWSTNIVIENNLLCGYLEGQTNMVHCLFNGERKSARVICPDSHLQFSF